MPPRAKTPLEEFQPYIDFAFVEFGMSKEAWLSQTPEEWAGIMEAWLKRERRADRRVARICAVLVGGNEEDFMPSLPSEEKDQTIDEMFVVLQSAAPK